MYLKPPGQDIRLHLKFKQLGNDVRNSFLASKTKTPSWGSILESAVNVIGNSNSFDLSSSQKSDSKETLLRFPLGGKTNNRVDYSLQPNVIDSEYIR